jgi:integrase
MARLERPYGQLTWQIRWVERDASGRRHWRSKTTGTRDRDEAQKKLELFEDARRRRIDRGRMAEILRTAGVSDVPEDVLLERLWDWYAGHCDVTGEARQVRARRAALNRFIDWLWSAHPELKTTREVTLKVASEYWKYMEEKKLSPSTRNNNLSALNTVWAAVHAPMELDSNPWSAIRRDRGGSVRYLPFTGEELAGLRREAAAYRSSMAEDGFWPAAVEMGYYTGLRLGDIASLDWAEVMDDGDFLVLVPDKTRRWGDDRVAVHSKSLPWVGMLPPPAESGLVWPRAAASMEAGNLSREFTAIAVLAGIRLDREPGEGERRTGSVRLKCFHSLRHTFATEALRRGVSEEELKEQGNWASVGVISGHYNHAKLEQAKKAALKVAETMRGA